jgi:thiol-disulfide isomerase/thioredoxin
MLAGLLLALTTAPDPAVSVRAVHYDALTTAIRAAKGQVLVVDFWADFCLPCKREFPRLVALHEKHAADGLAVISVSLDDPVDPGTLPKVKRFLESHRATFTNLILDEKPELWQAKLKTNGPPCVYVFNRKGELARRFADEVDYAEVERLVTKLLKD